jgi:hypothetical protein
LFDKNPECIHTHANQRERRAPPISHAGPYLLYGHSAHCQARRRGRALYVDNEKLKYNLRNTNAYAIKTMLCLANKINLKDKT